MNRWFIGDSDQRFGNGFCKLDGSGIFVYSKGKGIVAVPWLGDGDVCSVKKR
jgi:hypothetical protein